MKEKYTVVQLANNSIVINNLGHQTHVPKSYLTNKDFNTHAEALVYIEHSLKYEGVELEIKKTYIQG